MSDEGIQIDKDSVLDDVKSSSNDDTPRVRELKPKKPR